MVVIKINTIGIVYYNIAFYVGAFLRETHLILILFRPPLPKTILVPSRLCLWIVHFGERRGSENSLELSLGKKSGTNQSRGRMRRR